MARRLTPILCVLNIGPGRNLLIREFDPRDGFALACIHRHLVQDRGDSSAGARSERDLPAISRGFGPPPRAGGTGDAGQGRVGLPNAAEYLYGRFQRFGRERGATRCSGAAVGPQG